MRILHVSDCYLPRLGGIELQVHDLAARQRLAGNDVTIVTATPAADREESVISVPSLHGIPSGAGLAQLRKIVAVGDFDVVHSHSSLVSPLAWSATRTAGTVGVPAVLTMHSMAPTLLTVPATGRLMESVTEAALLTAVSTAASAALSRTLPQRSIRVLPNGIEPESWRPRRPSRPSRVLTIVSVMRLAARKRPMPLLRILKQIRGMVPPAQPLRAVIVGAGPLDGTLRRAVRSSDLREWVSMPGRLPRPEIQRLFEQADVYLAPARQESFGIAALEARCAGLPVVAMACGGVSDFISHGAEGFLAESDADMARAAAALLKSPDWLRDIQQHNRVSDPLMTWPRVLELTADAYRRAAFLVSRKPAGAEQIDSVGAQSSATSVGGDPG